MKFRHVIHLFLLLSLITLLQCTPRQEYGIKFENEDYNFGTVAEGADVELEFVFKNIGKNPIIIEDVKPSCGCTTTSQWDKEVASGQNGHIPITFKSRGYRGEVSKSVNVMTNIPGKEKITLVLKGIVITSVEIDPVNAYLGDVSEEIGPVKGTFSITNNSGKPLEILDVIPPEGNLEYNLKVLKQHQKYRLDFTINPPFKGEEVVREKFIIKTNNEQRPEYEATFTYFKTPAIQVYPLKVMLNMENVGTESIERRINIRKHIDDPIAVENVEIFGTDKITFDIKEVNPATTYQIALKIPADLTFQEDTPIYMTFNVKNDPKQTVYTVEFEEYTIPAN